MQDNSTDNTAEMLVRYLDDEMDAAERAATEKLLSEDAALQERYQYFLAAKRAIWSQGLRQRVQAIHQEYMQEAQPEQRSNAAVAKRSSPFKTILRIAAVLIVVVAGYGVFQYTATTNQSVYNNNFIAYQLPVNRSSETTANIDALYNAGNYTAVIAAFNAVQPKDQKAYFLAAQSYLQLNNAGAAIKAFQQVENLNNSSTEKRFEQETDYYLMLAYIKGGDIEQATKKWEKITSNKQHLFYHKASEISRTQLRMLQWKDQ